MRASRSSSSLVPSRNLGLLFALGLVLLLVLSLALPSSAQKHSGKERKTVHTDEVDEEIYDEDEFVGFEPKKQAPEPEPISPQETTSTQEEEPATSTINEAEKQQTDKTTEKLIEQRLEPTPGPRGYWLEATYIGVILAYLINFWMGKRKNESIAHAWLQANAKFFITNFSRIGDLTTGGFSEEDADEVVNKNSDKMLTKETHSTFKLRATGRINCIGLQVTLKLKKRHDLFATILDLFSKDQERVMIDVLMDPEAMEKFVFAVVKKKDEKRYRKTFSDISTFTGPAITPPGLPATLCVCSEMEELVPALLHAEVLHTLKNYHDMLIRMHFSDQGIVSTGYKNTLSFEFTMPSETEMNKLHTLTKMAIHYIDLVARLTLSKSGKQKSEANRAKIAEAVLKQTRQQREEALQQKKLEKKQKEKEKLASLSPAEQARLEEKIQKREMKKRQPKFKVPVG